eukprot:7866499-Pyramimonas_sp.AAC.1
MGCAPPCGLCRWGLRWSSLWGHEPPEGCAKIGGGPRMRTLRRRQREESRGALSLQNEDPTPMDGWEKGWLGKTTQVPPDTIPGTSR